MVSLAVGGMISQETYTRSVVNQGETAMFARFYEKLANGQCVKVAFFGGSITVGAYLTPGTPTWTAIFERLLHIAYPCQGQHEFIVHCQGAVASDHW